MFRAMQTALGCKRRNEDQYNCEKQWNWEYGEVDRLELIKRAEDKLDEKENRDCKNRW